ncbi:tetratricopeptide repeat protein [Paenibacillus sp. EC2-1]|uniref:tetratricopeptide repeat protein n=1 Tax=Paenibacillus sp. EC2-1 TaxID=3388665 RepID=UPI003BEF4653
MNKTTNLRAIEALENNDYDSSLLLFKQAVEESRNIQSLNNLAFLYISEGIRNQEGFWECGDLPAIELLRECTSLHPSSHFPYSLIGEAYLNLEQWQEAVRALEKAVSFDPSSPIAYYNLAIAFYQLHDVEKAAFYFSKAADKSELAKYAYAKCLIDLNQFNEAGRILDALIHETDDYVGDVEIAELYVEMKQYGQAVVFFEKSWDEYAKEPVWVDRYIYSLLKMGQHHRIETSVQQITDDNLKLIEEIQMDTSEDEHWSLVDREERIRELVAENNHFHQIQHRISVGYTPPMHFQPSVLSDCYWFGCKRHSHPEYSL